VLEALGVLDHRAVLILKNIAKHTKVDMIWVAGRSPTLVSHSLRGVAMNLKATTLTYLAIVWLFRFKLGHLHLER
jgi:steroid 5-alpha reductase family enzyme